MREREDLLCVPLPLPNTLFPFRRIDCSMTTLPFSPRLLVVLLLGSVLANPAAPLHAQDGQSLDLTIRNYGLSVGNAPRVNGVRLNYRDRGLVRVNGLNATLWRPQEVSENRGATGVVNGVALGLPATGAATINGVAVGLLGIEAHASVRGMAVGGLGTGAGENLSGLAIGGLGLGAGEQFTGIGIGGLGVGAGEDVRGIAIGGLGVGAGKDVRGIVLGGLGAGAGEHLSGLAVGGLGVGAGEDIKGIAAGGLGVGAGESLTGIALALVGVGAGEDMTGIAAGGVGLGAGEHMKGLFAAGVGIGATAITGVAVGAAVGSERYTGLAVAPAYFRITDTGGLRGVSVSAFNQIKGTQQGLTIGLFNFARVLNGVQLGVLNYAGNNPRGLRLLPGLNVNL